MAELQPIIVFHSRHCVRHLGICNLICVKLLQLMSGVIMHNSVKNEASILINAMSCIIPRNLKKTTSLSQTVSWGLHTRHTYTHRQTDRHTHTHTHDDSIRRNIMRCISPKNKTVILPLVLCVVVVVVVVVLPPSDNFSVLVLRATACSSTSSEPWPSGADVWSVTTQSKS